MQRWLSFIVPRSAQSAVRLLISIVLALTFLAFVGWAFHIPLLNSVSAQWISMSLITAVCLTLAAIELSFLQQPKPLNRRRAAVLAPGILVGLAGLLSVALYAINYASGWEPAPDGNPILYLFWGPVSRMALLTSILFVAAAGAITLLAIGDRRAANLAHALAAPAAVASYVVPVGYLLNVPELTASVRIAVAMNTGLAFCALFAAVFFSRPDTWLMSVLQGDRPGSIMTRRLLPALLIAPLVVGWLRLYGERSGIFGSGVGVVLVAVTYSVGFLWLLWANARSVNRTDDLRRSAERAVRESENRYHSLFEGMTEGFALCETPRNDVDKTTICRFLKINRAFEQLARMPYDAVIGKTWGEVLPAADPALVETLAAVARTGETARFDFSAAASNRRYDVYAYRPAPDQVAVVLTDVTERQRADEALRKSEARFRLLSATAGRLLAEKNPQTVVNELCREVMAHLDCQAFFNFLVDEKAGRLHLNACAGIPEEEARRISWLEYGTAVCGCVARDGARIVAEDIPNTPDVRTALVRSYGIRAYACHPLMAQEKVIGTLSFGTTTRSGFSDEDLALMKTVADQVAVAMDRIRSEDALRDLTATLEQRVAERTAALRRQGEMFQKTIDNIPVMLTFHDDAMRSIALNREFERALGWTTEAARGVDLPAAICPEPADRQALAEYIGKAEPGWRDFVLTRKDGSRLASSWANVRLSDGSRIGIGIDITERKRAEEQLRELNASLEKRAHQLRAMAAELTQAEDRERRRLAEVLHDHLQQLLVGAKFSVATVQIGVDDAKVRQGLDQVKDLLNQSIDASRSLTAEICPPILYDGGLAEATQWLARWMKEKHGLDVDLRLDDHVDVPTNTRMLLFQALREVLFNVVKHAGVHRAEVRVGRAVGELLKIDVADCGRGFDPAQPAAADRTVGGFGLFSIGERLEWIGGRMEVASAPGAGTRVSLLAPLYHDRPARVEKPVAAPRRRDAEEPVAPGSALRVLIADDHRMVREGLALLLSQAVGIEVVGQAEDGRQAVEMARQLAPDVVLMDITMPRMTGIEATRIIVAEQPQCCVLGLSMHQQDDMGKVMRDAGAAAYLMKDGPAESLINTVREVAMRRPNASSRLH
jgi:PAS domain S-box-containing protein